MGYSRERWHSGLTYKITCDACRHTFKYDDYRLGFRPWFADGFVYCERCNKPLRHNENLAINNKSRVEVSEEKEETIIKKTQSKIKYCQNCGEPIDINAKFCSSCGTKTSFESKDDAIERENEKLKRIQEDYQRQIDEMKKAEEQKRIEESKKAEELKRQLEEIKKNEELRRTQELNAILENKKKEEAKMLEEMQLLKKREQKNKNNNKCPNCGEILNSFALVCPSCGCELRGQEASFAINEFVNIINNCEDEKKVSNIIRTFPIPNNKEDLYEFLLIAKSNIRNYDLNGDGILNDNEKELMLAWITKFDQCYDKAKILFSDEKDLALFEKANQEMELTKRKIAKNKVIFSKESNSSNIRQDFKRARGSKVAAILGSVLAFILLIISSGLGGYIATYIALLMWGLFILVFLLGTQAIKIRIRKIYILPAALGYLLFIVYLIVLVSEVS